LIFLEKIIFVLIMNSKLMSFHICNIHANSIGCEQFESSCN